MEPLASLPPGMRHLTDLDAAWAVRGNGPQLRAVRVAAEKLHESFVSGPRCHAVRTLPLTTLPYPTRFAFNGAANAPFPFVTLTHRALLVQFFQGGELRNLLMNPSDIEAARATPFFARLQHKFGDRVTELLQTKYDPLDVQLATLGLSPSHIHYIAFDHFHTQDLRNLLGTTDGRSPRFPNAKLLAPRVEWADWEDLHPMQRAWFVADGKHKVCTENVVLTDADLMLGNGVMLLRTPGHTSGNQTLFLNTSEGIWGTSENGTAADNWSPQDSKIGGLLQQSRTYDVEVILNSNTPELAATQYTSMVLEKTVASRVSRAPAFVQMFPSSEVTPSIIAPGVTPTIVHRTLNFGTLALPGAASAA
jgi:hypothetical protein